MSVGSLQFDGVHVVSGSLDTSIRVWDVETGNCIHTLTGHQSLTSGMELKDNILVSGNADSTVKIWDIKTGQCLQTLQGDSAYTVFISAASQSASSCLLIGIRGSTYRYKCGSCPKLAHVYTKPCQNSRLGTDYSQRGQILMSDAE